MCSYGLIKYFLALSPTYTFSLLPSAMMHHNKSRSSVEIWGISRFPIKPSTLGLLGSFSIYFSNIPLTFLGRYYNMHTKIILLLCFLHEKFPISFSQSRCFVESLEQNNILLWQEEHNYGSFFHTPQRCHCLDHTKWYKKLFRQCVSFICPWFNNIHIWYLNCWERQPLTSWFMDFIPFGIFMS